MEKEGPKEILSLDERAKKLSNEEKCFIEEGTIKNLIDQLEISQEDDTILSELLKTKPRKSYDLFIHNLFKMNTPSREIKVMLFNSYERFKKQSEEKPEDLEIKENLTFLKNLIDFHEKYPDNWKGMRIVALIEKNKPEK